MKSTSAAGSQVAPPAPVAAQGRGLRIRSHLVLLIMAALVPMIIFSTVMMFMHAQQARSVKTQLLANMAEETAERVDSQLRRTVAGLQALGQSDALRNHDLRAFHALAGRLTKAEQWDHLALFGPDGEHLVNTRQPFGVALPPLSRPDLPRQAATSRQPLVSDMMKGALSDRPITVIYVPVVQGQTVKYVIGVAIEPARWQQLIRDQMGKGRGMEATLFDRHSKVIVSTYKDTPVPGAGGITSVSWASGSDPVDTGGQRTYVASYKTGMSDWTVVTFVPMATFDSPLRGMIVSMAAGFLLLLLSGISLALLLGHRTANSMAQLVASVRAVAAGGAPLAIKSHVLEVTQASQAVNETAALLAGRRSELEAANQAKNAFLALLGHELRNPLAPIRNAVQLIKQDGTGGEAGRWAASVIDRQSAHLARLVDDLLDVTRIDHGKIELRKEIVDLRQLLQNAAQDHWGILEEAGVRFTLDVPPTPVLANCDRVRLAQIVGNLLHNATKFTPRGGLIGIRLTQDGPLAIVEVSDNGSGISPDNLERIFELFAQEQPSGLGGNVGLGIGLALARKLVALHGGTVTAASAGPGQGSTFRIELPAMVIAPEDDAAFAGTAAPAGDHADARVLVVDDNKDCADTLGEMLAMSGYANKVAYSGKAALAAVEHDLPDVVLLDIGLPDIDGYEVCRRIRSSGIKKQPVLIALTGWGQEQDRDAATTAGFDAHLTKPADVDQVIALVQESLDREGSSPGLPAESGLRVHRDRQLELL